MYYKGVALQPFGTLPLVVWFRVCWGRIPLQYLVTMFKRSISPACLGANPSHAQTNSLVPRLTALDAPGTRDWLVEPRPSE